MTKETKIKWALCAVSAVLALMGLCFAWRCPIDCVYGVDSGVFFFKKQLLWNGIGIGACVAAAWTPWRRWLKLAPWGMAAWLVLAALAMLCMPHHGSHRWADFGFVRVNVHLVFVFAWALFTAWLCSKKRVRPWMVFTFCGVLLATAGVFILGNANRLGRVAAFFGSEEGSALYTYAQTQMKAAYATAHWFGDADRCLRCLPLAYADAMPSAAALLFGKWFTLAAAALFAALGGLLTWIWLVIGSPSKRMFAFFWGGATVSAAMYSFCQSVGLVPALGVSPALAGYGGACTVTFWAGLGVVFSMLSDKDGEMTGSRGKTIAAGGIWSVLFTVFALGVATASTGEVTFYAPLPKVDGFGAFGIRAKRGEIFAEDGSVLARTVRRWDIRLDPKTAREYRLAFNSESVENICSRLKLTRETLLDLYGIGKSRYILVRSGVDDAVAAWFRSPEGRRLSKGFILEAVQKREYPLGRRAVHVTGCVRRGGVNQGATGVEYTSDAVLAGRDGTLVRDAGRAEQRKRARPVHGGSVTTTVRPRIQNILADALAKAAATNRAATAWGVVMDAASGGVAAMASLPSYDPEGPRDLQNGPDYFVNNAAMAVFEPGGLMKPLTYALAIDRGLVRPETPINHGDGTWDCFGARLHDVPGATGTLSVVEALLRRTEIGAAKTGYALWKDRDFGGLYRFGFGRKVGGGTVYGEESGIVRAAEKTDPVTLTRLGLGRGLAVTGLQIAGAYAALANGGKTVAPHLVAKTVSTNGAVCVFTPDKPSVQVVSAATAATVTRMMKEAMAAAAREFSVDLGGLDAAGVISETRIPSRGRYSETDYNVSAAGFFPSEKPKWVVAIGFSKPAPDHAAGRLALPVFAEIAQRISAGSRK